MGLFYTTPEPTRGLKAPAPYYYPLRPHVCKSGESKSIFIHADITNHQKHTDLQNSQLSRGWQFNYFYHTDCSQRQALTNTNWLERQQHRTPHTTHTRLTAIFPGLPGWAGTRKEKPIWILLKQETVSGSGISWAICKSAPRSRQITTPAPTTQFFLQAGCPSCRPTNSVILDT